jgi:Rrf2 family protein
MNSRFAVATFAMTFMSMAQERLVTSEELAASISTHPALVRRLLSLLREAGLVDTQLGPGGGARLARAPERISLLEVYDAIRAAEDLFAVGRISPNPDCPLGTGIQATLSCVLAKPQDALRVALSRVSIRTLLDEAAARVPPAVAAAHAGRD